MGWMRNTMVLVACVVLSACAAPRPQDGKAGSPPVILISLDGFHPELLDAAHTPTLARLAREGVHGEGMRPSYPSLTFPNHYTLVTGLRPDRHGMVDNTMLDPELGRFSLHDRAAVEDARWWGGEPLWNTLARDGRRSATMFWPGSEAPIQGRHPHWWRRFDKDLPIRARVAQVLEWLALPTDSRPHFVTLYFEHTDSTGHDHGPLSREQRDAARDVDAALGDLVRGLTKLGLEANLVIVSDHGMASIAPERLIAIEDVVSPDTVEVVTSGSMLSLAPKPGYEDEVAAALRAAPPQMQCWPKAGLSPQWHYGSHPRIPPWVCQMATGWRIHPAERIAEWRRNPLQRRGAHGYDPLDPSMRALFVAHGPAFVANSSLPLFDNPHVHALLAHLLDVDAGGGEGSLDVFAAVLRSNLGSAPARIED